MRFDSTQHKAIEAEASGSTTLRENGTAPASGYRGTALDPVPSDAMCAVARRLGGFVYDVRFEPTQGDRGRSKWLRDFTRERHRVQGQGPASKVRTGFEGAHCF